MKPLIIIMVILFLTAGLSVKHTDIIVHYTAKDLQECLDAVEEYLEDGYSVKIKPDGKGFDLWMSKYEEIREKK